jgi:hypothetical protein
MNIDYIGNIKTRTHSRFLMNSLTLKEKGFVEFHPIKELSFSLIPLDKPVVLALVDKSLSGKPSSDILFIGKTKKPAKRIFAGYFAGYGGKTTKRINAKLVKDGYMEKTMVSWMLSDDAKTAQETLLEDFKKEHGQYPQWNTLSKKPEKDSKPKKPVQAAVKKKIKAAKPSSV